MKKDDMSKQGKNMQVNVNLDTTPILFTDNVMMTANEDGVVLDVCQRVGNSNQVRVVARIGMSRSHAEKLLKQMGDLLLMADGRSQTGKMVN